MNCERMETRLIAYLDGRASESERRDVESHLAACRACRTRADEFRRLWGVLEEVPAMEPSPTFDARLSARIAAEPPRRSMWSWLMPSPRLAFAISMLLLMSVYISSLPPDPGPGNPQHVAYENTDAGFRMIRDLTVLENYDVLANFEALSELTPPPTVENREM